MKQFKRIYIEITNVCNLNCSFCPPLERKPKFMHTDKFTLIIDKIAPYTDYIYLHIKGEPLLHPNLKEILDICYRKGIYANITTNGTRLSNVEDILYHAPALRQINISLHSFENIDLTRLKELDEYLDRVIINARKLSDNTNTITALRLWNLDKDNLVKDSFHRNTYIMNRLIEAFPKGDFASLDSEQNKHNGIKLANNIYLNFDYEFVWPSLTAPYMGDEGYCYGLKTQLGILVDGTVVPCCLDGNGIIQLGNILNDDFRTILGSPKARTIAEGFACRKVTEELCKHCGYRERF